MKKALAIGTLLMTAIAQVTPAHAEASKEENVGVASGALLGAAAGGPVGFILGAAFGGIIGGEVEKANQVDVLQAELNASQVQQQHMKEQIGLLKEELTVQQTDTSVAGSDMLQMDVLFHTNQVAMDDTDEKRIARLAEFLKRYPGLTVKLDGFADPRGNMNDNKVLSEQRIQSVKAALITQGIDEERLLTEAHGESASVAPEGNLDAYALERRVSIRFFSDHATSSTVASNQ